MQQESKFSLSKVLGDFRIENHHFLIISPESHFDPLKESDSKFLPAHVMGSVVGQLKMNEKKCVIVEVENYSMSDNNSEITAFLTGRELQIVELIAQGHSNKQIAYCLNISAWTVSTHLRRVFAKLGVDSRAAMVYRCFSLLSSSK